MIRRLTVACGLLTLAVVFVLAMQDHTLFGTRTPHHGVPVTTIPDKPAAFGPEPVKPGPPAPPLKGLPPNPRPQPLQHTQPAHRAAAPAPAQRSAGSAVQNIVNIANTLLNLPKIINDATQVNSR